MWISWGLNTQTQNYKFERLTVQPLSLTSKYNLKGKMQLKSSLFNLDKYNSNIFGFIVATTLYGFNIFLMLKL